MSEQFPEHSDAESLMAEPEAPAHDDPDPEVQAHHPDVDPEAQADHPVIIDADEEETDEVEVEDTSDVD